MLTKDSIKQPFWAMKTEEVFRALEAREEGLSEGEVLDRRNIFGLNVIVEQARLAKVKIILNQFRSPLILILVAAGGVTLFLGEWTQGGVIFATVLVNSALGFYQENKAENALGVLKSYIRTRTRAKREGREREIDASELVPGDVIRVSPGDRVPADARLLYANNLEADEAVLTGESLPVEKQIGVLAPGTALSDRRSMIFSGTLAVGGFADAVVTSIGNATEFGKIAVMVGKQREEETPLQKAITKFSVQAGLVLAVFVAGLFGLGLYAGRDLFEMFLIGVAVAVAAVPEGLPVALTVILAIGVERLAKKKAVVRRLLAAETLGSITLILTDKTGTLTQAKMELARVIPFEGNGEEAERELLRDAILNTDVAVENPEERPENWKILGKAMEAALVRGAAAKGVLSREDTRQIVDRLPFSSQHKFSAVVAHTGTHAHLVVLGAPEILLRYTDLTEEEKTSLLKKIEIYALYGERVLGVIAKPETREHRKFSRDVLRGFKFKGLVTFRDPLRPTVREAIRRISSSGVKTVILTGDHQGTAEAVARDLGMLDGKGAVLTGEDLSLLKPEELANRADEVTVYARVTPEQKVQITELYKKKGEIVAVTGDGVNDAPALETADIGVAVGSGTDVAKSSADLVLLDDNLETLVTAIEEGRKILNNIRKVIVYLLSSVLDELLLIGGAIILGLTLPLNALQILFVNLFSESFPAIGFAFEKGVDGPGGEARPRGKGIFDPEVKFLIAVIGVLTSLLLFGLYYFLLRSGVPEEQVRSFIFATFATYSLLVVFSLRDLEKSIFSYNPFSNLYLNGGVLLGLGLTISAIFVPFMQEVFGTVPLPPKWLAAVLGMGLLNILLVEFGKRLFRRKIL